MAATELVQLYSEDIEVVVCPQVGGATACFAWKGTDILRRAPDSAVRDRQVRQMGVYPLVPYSNRIGQAQLRFGDQTVSLRPNFPGEPHAIHGFGWQREWHVSRRTDDSAELRLGHTPDADWPFACEAVQRVQLTADGLSLDLTVTNTDAQAMPAGLGFHPYFPLSADTRLQTEWMSVWHMSEDSLPTSLCPVPPQADFRASRPVAGWKVDHCFTGWSRRVCLDYASHQVWIKASDACRQIVVFAPDDGRNFIALEPVTNINNAFALATQGVPDTGMRTLAPGESLAISMSIGVCGKESLRGRHA